MTQKSLNVDMLRQRVGQLKQVSAIVKNAGNNAMLLQMAAAQHPAIKKAMEVAKEYGGDYDKATAALIEENGLDPGEVRGVLAELGLM